MSRIPTIEWRDLATTLRNDIEAGVYPIGGQLPSEPALMKEYGGGRHSVRRALHELAVAGLIHTRHGRGSFVKRSDVLNYRISLRTRAHKVVSDEGRVCTDQPVSEETVPANRVVADALQIPEGELVYRILRHGFADDLPVCVTTSYHPVARFPDIDKARHSLRRLTDIYASYGVLDYVRLRTTVCARTPTADVARVLRLSANQPVLVTHKIDADLNGVPIAYAEACWPGNRIQFVIDNSMEIAQMQSRMNAPTQPLGQPSNQSPTQPSNQSPSQTPAQVHGPADTA